MKGTPTTRLKIVSFSVLFGFLAYILDAVFEYYIFHKEDFWNLLILNVPPHELSIRFVIIGLFILFGILISGLFSSRRIASNAISETDAFGFSDTTAGNKAEEALKRAQFSVDKSIDAVYWIGPDARFIYVNEAACKALGYSREELLNSTVHDIDPNFPPEVWPAHWEEIKRKGSFIIESNHRKKDGRIFPVEIAINYFKIDGEEYNCAFARDITERKKTEEALRESEEKFRNLSEQSPNMIFINKQGGIVYANRRCVEIMGYSRKELYSDDFDFRKLIAPEYTDAVNENLAKQMKGEEIEPFEYVIVTRDGRRIDAIISTKLIKYEGETSILGIVTDITERKKTEEALQKNKRDLLKAQQMAKIGSWEWELEAKKIYWSDEMYRIYGIQKGTRLTVDLLRRAIYPEDLNIFDKAVKDVLAGIPPKFAEYRIIRPGADITYVQSMSEAQYNDRGDPVRLIGSVQDITERKKAEELREKLIADLQKAANEIKTLSGFIPICASCKKIRDDKGYWEQIETYIMEHSDAEFSHGLCPECMKKLYPDL